MNTYQEPKYKIAGDKLVNRQDGIPIPDDEPLFLIRAKDHYALSALMAYLRALPEGPHKEAVSVRCAQFSNWQALHSSRVTLPTTTRDDNWTSAGTGGGPAPVISNTD